MKMRIIFLLQAGGYATHVIVEHPKFLVDFEGLNLDMIAAHACAGLTVYNALSVWSSESRRMVGGHRSGGGYVSMPSLLPVLLGMNGS